MRREADIVIIGAGAAGLMAAIWAGRSAAASSSTKPTTIIAFDGARSLGAKILVAGGGRCNVTHHHVDERAFAGSSRNAIKKVLRQFDVEQTIAFFLERGVELKREETGKLFPVTDKARTVLNALLGAARDAGAEIVHPWRVERVNHSKPTESNLTDSKPTDLNPWAFTIVGALGEIRAKRIILATGGKALPKSGSDGHGYTIARSLGHTLTDRIFPALVPLTLPSNHFVCALSGLTLPATLELRAGTGKRLVSFTNSTLCAHFGLSGPSVLDISRYYLDAIADDPKAHMVINWLPGETLQSVDQMLQEPSRIGIGRRLAELLPERLARELCAQAKVDPSLPGTQLRREQRRALATLITETPLPITGDRGFTHAEVTAGGVPLSEIHLNSMESRVCPGLYLCGEICDVDGRIGGFNFQWAWASGYVAGVACGRAIAGAP